MHRPLVASKKIGEEMSSEGVESKSLRLRSVQDPLADLGLQIVATASLAALVLTMTSKYGECDEDFIKKQMGELLVPSV